MTLMSWMIVCACSMLGGLLWTLGWLVGHRRGVERGRVGTLSKLILGARCSCCEDREWSAQDGAVLEALECKT